MDTDHVMDKIQEGIAAASEGNKELAYKLLKEATEANPTDELGWLWLAGVTDTPEEAASYLERVLEINPFNEQALSGWKWVQAKLEGSEATPSKEVAGEVTCPLCLKTLEGETHTCPGCKAYLSLADMDRLLRNTEVNKEVMVEAISRHEDSIAEGGTFETHYALALAYLNLSLIEDCMPHLEIALRECPDDRVREAHVERLRTKLKGGADQQKTSLTKPAGGNGKSDSLSKGKQASILVVDDSPTVLKLVEITLEKQGYNVVLAANGLEGLGKISEDTPDLILLDITMPHMDGYQFCKTVKSNRDTEHIPVIMLSGKDGFMDRVKGRMVGVESYITKPFDPIELAMVVKEHLDPGRDRLE